MRSHNINNILADTIAYVLEPSVPRVGTSSAHGVSIIIVKAFLIRSRLSSGFIGQQFQSITSGLGLSSGYISSCNVEEGVRSKLGAT